ncbi:MAG TPA: PGPGW domain-containing protein [Longimicrobiaceae bacterium]|nr:PGPGW domain-containing protein [Longimicrobiaceae bacterium]
MLDKLKKSWHEIEEADPGSRFQERYRQRQRQGGSGPRKPLFIGGGIAIMVAGVFFLPAPGPGFLILFIGAGLLAQESLLAARALDRTEVKLRALAGWGMRVWRSSPLPVKVLLVLVGAALAAGAAYLGYRVVFAR